MAKHTYTITITIAGEVHQVFADSPVEEVSKTHRELQARGYRQEQSWGGLNEHGGNRWVLRYTNDDQRYSHIVYEIVDDSHEPVAA